MSHPVQTPIKLRARGLDSMTTSKLDSLFNNWFLEVNKDLQLKGSFWTPSFVTGYQGCRTVVLRSVIKSDNSCKRAPSFVIHTDVRSQKWQDLIYNPNGALHFYCSHRRWQVRVDGTSELFDHHQPAIDEWSKLSHKSRKLYCLDSQPGTVVRDPKPAYAGSDCDDGFENFGVVVLTAKSMESLQLEGPDRSEYHVRAFKDFTTGESSYLAP